MQQLLILLLTVLPKHGMSRVAGWLASLRVRPDWRASVYRGYARVFGVNLAEVGSPLESYESVNAFFTRTLVADARPLAAADMICPVDGAVGAYGEVQHDTLVQAKGRNYSLKALLGGDTALAARCEGGTFTTLYLSPKDYHRIHSPSAGNITRAVYVPGALWPVNAAAVTHVDSLFAVNERIVITMEGVNGGVMAIVPVGATMVGMTRLTFDDLHTNARRRVVDARDYATPVPMSKGQQLGHFEFGSTVVLVCSPDFGHIAPLTVGAPVRLGQPMGTLAKNAQ
ncbi:MAG: phosphatidylserine decarboxylase [Gemmatimonadaceae bacterium]|nr:phosphatidylserine decarboxylase [Gemmatimonadaceae bacterium]